MFPSIAKNPYSVQEKESCKKLNVGLIHDDYSDCFTKVLSIWMKMLQKRDINVTA